MSGAVVWITGRPSAGKSKLARAAAAALRARVQPVVVLDGDEVRAALVPTPGYDPASRAAFYATLAGLAALLARQDALVLVAATANLRAYRQRARELSPRYLEVYVDVSEDVCRARDSKGLYELAKAGELRDLPSAGSAYEPPLAPDLRVTGGKDPAAVEALCQLVLSVQS